MSQPPSAPLPQIRFAGLRIHPMTVDEAVRALAARDPAAPFAACVTPNVEYIHLGRRDPAFAQLCEDSFLSPNDSRVLHRAGRLAGLELGFAPGAHLTERLLREAIASDEAVTVIGGDAAMIAALQARFGLTRVAQHIPPMGFIRDEAAVRAAADFIAGHPSRFAFIAVGPPQSELLCRRVIEDGRSTGLGLCIGSALQVASGQRRPAPGSMERAGLVWLWRLVHEPGRLWRRYLVHDLYGLGVCAAAILKARRGPR